MKQQNHFQKDFPRGLPSHSGLAMRSFPEVDNLVEEKVIQDMAKFLGSFSSTGNGSANN
jgi:hypothetical protein